MKKEFKLVDDTFCYKGTCQLGKQNGYIALNRVPECVEWIHEGHGNYMKTFNNLSEGDETFYTERLIALGLQDKKSSKKYGILFEPRWYNPTTLEIKRNPQPYIDAYEYIFTHDKELIQSNPDFFKFIPGQGALVEENGLFEKTKLVSCCVSDKVMSEGHRLRLEFARELEKTGQVDMYGYGADFKYAPTKLETLKDYMFQFCLENDSYESYYTEKIHDCFLTGTIPIYYGAPDIGDFYNIDGIIMILPDENGVLSFNSECLTEEYYKDHYDAVKENYEIALTEQTIEDYIYRNYLK